jgi:predicted ArsR family transcriptional regulator
MFPRRYDLLAQFLFEELGNLSPGDIEGLSADEKRSLFMQRMADRIAAKHRNQLVGRDLHDRVAATADLLHTIGGFAEWLPADGGYEIRDYNCVFASILPSNEVSGCEWHVRLLTSLLEHPVSHEVVSNGTAQCCRYVVAASPNGNSSPATKTAVERGMNLYA